MGTRHHQPDGGGTGAIVFLQPADKIVAQGFDSLMLRGLSAANFRLLRLRHGIEHPDRKAAAGLAAEFEGAQDRGVGGRTKIFILFSFDFTLRRPADAAGVKELVHGKIAVPHDQPVIENVFALDEEGALFFIKGFKGSEVDLRGIGLDLPEIGIDGEIHGQVRGDARLAVQAALDVAGAAGRKGVVRIRTARAQIADGVGEQFNAVGLDEILQAVQLTEKVDHS